VVLLLGPVWVVVLLALVQGLPLVLGVWVICASQLAGLEEANDQLRNSSQLAGLEEANDQLRNFSRWVEVQRH